MTRVFQMPVTVFAVACLSFGGWFCQRHGRAASAVETPAPSPAAEMVVAGLGGFRGIAAEVVWFRADRLQSEGRFAELAQLATWLTFFEPHTAEVWVYAAWNLAYNISVMMPTPEDRWRWVEAGLRLLRDDGLRLNPGDPVVYRELSWLFLQKIGGHLDSAAPHYRAVWKTRVEEARKSGTLAALGFDEKRMKAVDDEYGAQDWTQPMAAALYWAVRGLEVATRADRHAELRQLVYQALMFESRADARFAPRALKELRTAYDENPDPALQQMIDFFRKRHGLE